MHMQTDRGGAPYRQEIRGGASVKTLRNIGKHRIYSVLFYEDLSYIVSFIIDLLPFLG